MKYESCNNEKKQQEFVLNLTPTEMEIVSQLMAKALPNSLNRLKDRIITLSNTNDKNPLSQGLLQELEEKKNDMNTLDNMLHQFLNIGQKYFSTVGAGLP